MIFGRFRKKRSRTETRPAALKPTTPNADPCEVIAQNDAGLKGEDQLLRQLNWPVAPQRQRVKWFPARQRLIGLVRGNRDAFVLPPAVVRKSPWRE
jgi:hypothetical protein